MTLFSVDPDKCDLCGICLEECPFHLLEMKTKDALPTPVATGFRPFEDRCIHCGHCIAVCPAGALKLENKGASDCVPMLPELKVSPQQINQLLMGRRTHRAYKDSPVPRETLEKIIRVARYAPSPHNMQLAKWLVMSDKGEIRRIGQTVIDWMLFTKKEMPEIYQKTDADLIVSLWEKGVDSIFRGAPHLIVLYGEDTYASLRPAGYQFPIRLSYLELAAATYGLGTCWIGFLVLAVQFWPPTSEALQLPKGNLAYDAIVIGYPKNRFQRIPPRNEPLITWR